MQIRYLLLVTLLAGNTLLPAQAASCRAASAAQIGAQAGYNKDKQAAQAWADRENQVSSGSQQCLGSISTTLTVPTFPDLNALLGQVIDKVCNTARGKIQQYIPSTIDPWGDVSSETHGVVGTTTTNLPRVPSHMAVIPPAAVPVLRNTTPPITGNGDYLFSN